MNTVSSIWRKRAAQPVLGVFLGLVLVLQTAAPTATVFAQEVPQNDPVVTEEQAPAPDEQPAPQEDQNVPPSDDEGQVLGDENKDQGENERSSLVSNQNQKVKICHKEGNGSFHEIEINQSAYASHLAHGDKVYFPWIDCSDYNETGKLTLVKKVVGGQGQGSASLWTLTADGEVDDLSGTTPVSGDVLVGNYDLSESGGPSDYVASDWVCMIDKKRGDDVPAPMDDNTVTVGKDQKITCTITNTYQEPDPVVPNLHFIKVVCDDYSDITGNANAANEDDTNGNYIYFNDGVVTKPVGPAEIPGKESGCYTADGWSFLLSTDIGQDSKTQVVGPTTGGEYVTPVTGEGSDLNEALQSGIENGAFWVSEVEQEGYGFAALRCYNDALNGDNLEFVNLGEISPNTPSDIYCIAYNIQSVPDTEPCGTELIANGGFEVPAIEGGWDIVNNGTAGLGWSVEWMPSIPGGAPDPASVELHRGVNGWLPQEGQQHAELDGDWGGPSSGQSGEDGSSKIYQTLATVPGSEYTISYWTSPRPGIADNQIRFSWDGTVVETVVENGSANSQTVWTQHTHTLTATDTTTVIEFADLSVGDSLGSFIDNVSVKEECPDPCESDQPTKPGIFTAVLDFVSDAVNYPNDDDECISTISGMKYNDLDNSGTKDAGEPGLAGWDIYAYDVIPSSNITVDAADITGSDTNWVAPGEYVVMSRGTWNNGGTQYFDTEFHTPDSWATHEDGVVPYGTDIGDLIINNGSGDMFVDWGVYNDQNENGFEHYYFYILNHPGGNINYSVFDGTGGVKNAGWYGDNTGSLNVQMFKLMDTAVTDVNGNYTLSFDTTNAVKVVVREFQQNGWEQTSPNSSMVPYALNGLTEGVNYPITGNWNFVFEANVERNVTDADFGNHYVGEEEEDQCEEIKYDYRDQSVLVDNEDQYRNCAITGYKYSDFDGDASVNGDDDGLAGWRIYIDENDNNVFDEGEEPSDVTDANGYYSFTNLPAGTYTIREVNQAGWDSIFPTNDNNTNEYVINLVLTSHNGTDFHNQPDDQPCEEVSEEVTLISTSDTETAGYTTGPINDDTEGLTATNYGSGSGLFTDSVATTYIGAWIDPTTNPNFAGSGAVWISTDLEHPGDSEGEGLGTEDQWRLFQTKFNIPTGATITPGTLYFTADNAVSVYLNGAFLDDTSEDLVTYGPNLAVPNVFQNVYSVPFTPEVGDNTLSFVLRNSGVELNVNPTGLLYKGDFSYVVDCDDDGGNGGDGDDSSTTSSGSGSNRSGRVLGDSTGLPYEAPGRILGATTLPRTGNSVELYTLLAFMAVLMATPLLSRKTAK